MSCVVIGRDGAMDLQVQGRGHGGLLTADLWPWTERTDRRCQVNHIWACFLFLSFSPLRLPSVPWVSSFCCLSFYCLVFHFSFFQWLLVHYMSNDRFLYRCFQKPEKNALGTIVFVKPSQVCVCVCLQFFLWIRLWIWKALQTFSASFYCGFLQCSCMHVIKLKP